MVVWQCAPTFKEAVPHSIPFPFTDNDPVDRTNNYLSNLKCWMESVTFVLAGPAPGLRASWQAWGGRGEAGDLGLPGGW